MTESNLSDKIFESMTNHKVLDVENVKKFIEDIEEFARYGVKLYDGEDSAETQIIDFMKQRAGDKLI